MRTYTVAEYGVIGEPSPIGPLVAELKRRVKLWNKLVEIENDIRQRLYLATSDEAILADITRLRAERESLWAEAAAASFPPTYRGGYERIYKRLDEVFDWPKPSYQPFDEKSFDRFIAKVADRRNWMLARDHEIPALRDHLRGVIQMGARSKPVYVYASGRVARVSRPEQSIEALRMPRLAPGMMFGTEAALSVAPISQGQMNTLRSEYLSKMIAPSPGLVNLAVLVDGHVIGALSFSRPRFGVGAYMLSDFAIRPTLYRRLSKLVVAAALSSEVRALIEMRMAGRVEQIATTAFTERAASMKYRGLLETTGRKEGHVNYAARTGRWDLKEGMEWWRRMHAAA